jgi:hypothetical protein
MTHKIFFQGVSQNRPLAASPAGYRHRRMAKPLLFGFAALFFVAACTKTSPVQTQARSVREICAAEANLGQPVAPARITLDDGSFLEGQAYVDFINAQRQRNNTLCLEAYGAA